MAADQDATLFLESSRKITNVATLIILCMGFLHWLDDFVKTLDLPTLFA